MALWDQDEKYRDLRQEFNIFFVIFRVRKGSQILTQVACYQNGTKNVLNIWCCIFCAAQFVIHIYIKLIWYQLYATYLGWHFLLDPLSCIFCAVDFFIIFCVCVCSFVLSIFSCIFPAEFLCCTISSGHYVLHIFFSTFFTREFVLYTWLQIIAAYLTQFRYFFLVRILNQVGYPEIVRHHAVDLRPIGDQLTVVWPAGTRALSSVYHGTCRE